VRSSLGKEPPDDLAEVTTPATRIAMMWPLTLEAWSVAGRAVPTYDRRNLPARFRDLLVAFAEAGVEFVIVGAYAVAFHGAPRASGDIDVFVRPSPENATRVLSALARFGAPLEAAGLTAVDFTRPGTVYQIGLPPRRIDVMTEISGLTFDEAWARASRPRSEIRS
jgi:hypothetical protein